MAQRVRQTASMHGLWVTVERDPAKAGGLGEVSRTIPKELNKHLDTDIRVMVPGLKPILEKGRWVDTGEAVTLEEHWRQPRAEETYRLLQQYDVESQTWVYALANDRYFAPYQSLYFPGNRPNELGQDPMFVAVMQFNRAVAALLPRLSPSYKRRSPSAPLSQFKAELQFVIVHDWLTSPLLSLLPTSQRLGRIFMLHNTYDEQRPVTYAQALLGLAQTPSPNTYRLYSPLETGVYQAQVVIANKNYVRSLVQKDSFDFLVKNLWEKMTQGRLYDMHHGISSKYDPTQNAALSTQQYTELVRTSQDRWQQQLRRWLRHWLPSVLRPAQPVEHFVNPKELLRYKRTNKAALQAQFGLTPDPAAMIFSWVGRFDPFQKGFYLLMNEVSTFLRRHPRVQMIIAGTNSSADPAIQAFIEVLSQERPFQGRIHLQNRFVDRDTVIRICAGSDFCIMPSLYEPFGLAQLEAMKLGCIPIVHGVDGLRSTVFDPFIDQLEPDDATRERVWDYGQVGVKIELINVPAYHQAITRQMYQQELTHQDQWALADAQRKIKMALERSIRLYADETRRLNIIQNGMRYVTREHTWRKIIQRYESPIKRVILDTLEETPSHKLP
ncbi:MAG: glycogen/starch synthase [Candidatus Melainabacteria bacterium]|nr:glycogen/starch synthase [Candidatus Melainabacteria bacterium]